MRPASRNMIIGGSIAFLAVVTALVLGEREPEPSGARWTTVGWGDAGVPADVKCLRTTGLASEQALALFRMDAGAPGSQYVYVRICGSPADAGEDDPIEVPLPPGMEALAEYQFEEDFDGGPQLWASLDDFPAACSPGPDMGCEWLRPAMPRFGIAEEWIDAPIGMTLEEGRWRGNCVRKPPVELAGVSSWPAGCPQ